MGDAHASTGAAGDARCLNCGTGLIGAHCHACGQAAHVHRSLGAIGHDILHAVVHFEGRLWRTLPLLAVSPGMLTRRYIAGERARFVSPMALFLFSIFILFAAFSVFGLSALNDGGVTPRTQAEVAELRQGMQQIRQNLVNRRAQLPAGDERTRAIDRQIRAADRALADLRAGQPLSGPAASDLSINTGWKRLDKGIHKAVENPGLAAYKLQSNSYKFSWALIPLSLPFVWLMFAWRRDYGLYDHAVFVTYSIAFFSLLFIAVTIGAALGVPRGLLTIAVLLIAPVHMFRQLRDAYRLAIAGALIRTLLLVLASTVVLLVFLLLILGMNLVG